MARKPIASMQEDQPNARGRAVETRSRPGGPGQDTQTAPPRAENCAALRPDREPGNDREGLSSVALYRLIALLSPTFPVGTFSYSGGLEWAVNADALRDAASLERWLAVIISRGAGNSDAGLFVHVHRAVTRQSDEELASTAELAAALAPSKERHLESISQGAAFLKTARAAWPCAALDRLVAVWPGPYAYPVTVAAAAAGHGVPVEPALLAYLQATAVSLISAGLRLIPLGHTDGQRVLAALEPVILATVARAVVTPLDAIGSAAFRADLASQLHETQATRLFRS